MIDRPDLYNFFNLFADTYEVGGTAFPVDLEEYPKIGPGLIPAYL